MNRNQVLPIFVLLTLPLFGAACTASDAGCTSDTQCRPGRICLQARCDWPGGEPPANNGTNNGETNNTTNNEISCTTDGECHRDSLCRDGRCDEFQCRNEDGTDTSAACECNKFVYTELVDGCSHEQRCFSGNLLLECAGEIDAGNISCVCFEALQPVLELAVEPSAVCDPTVGNDWVYEACGWTLP